MAKTFESVVYSVDNEDIKILDEQFYDWLNERGDEAMEDAIHYFAEYLSEYIDIGDFAFDCLSSTKRLLGYKED